MSPSDLSKFGAQETPAFNQSTRAQEVEVVRLLGQSRCEFKIIDIGAPHKYSGVCFSGMKVGTQAVAIPTAQGDWLVISSEWSPAPIGEVVWRVVSNIPSGWLAADGGEVTTAHPALRAALVADGSPHGTANGNPLLPNLTDPDLTPMVRAS